VVKNLITLLLIHTIYTSHSRLKDYVAAYLWFFDLIVSLDTFRVHGYIITNMLELRFILFSINSI